MLLGARFLRWTVSGLVLSLAAVLGREWLPPRATVLTAPELTARRNFYGLGGAQGEWADAAHTTVRCRIPEGATSAQCALYITFTGPDPNRGIDLRGPKTLWLDVGYSGPAAMIRLSTRNFDPRFSRQEDPNTSRMQSISLRTRDLHEPIELGLNELTVPEWWITEFNLPRAQNRPLLDNVTTMAIDVQGTPGVHELRMQRIELRADWISREQLLGVLLVAWMTVVGIATAAELKRLRMRHLEQRRQLQTLDATTRHVRAENKRLHQLSTVDPLTDALNRRGVEAALAESGAAQLGAAVMMVDLDHFKQINDRYGHAVGDLVLARAAAAIRAGVRHSDLAGRWGGEEFVIIAVGCDTEGAARLAESLRQRIEALSFDSTLRVVVSASVGVAMMAPRTPFEDALQRADAALYRAKSTGRNRVCFDEPKPPAPPVPLLA